MRVLPFVALIALFAVTANSSRSQVVRVHEVTKEEYDELLRLTEEESPVTEARVLRSSLSSYLPSIFYENGKPGTPNKGYPLCVVTPKDGEYTKGRHASWSSGNDDDDYTYGGGHDSTSVGSNNAKNRPVVNCIVVVKGDKDGDDGEVKPPKPKPTPKPHPHPHPHPHPPHHPGYYPPPVYPIPPWAYWGYPGFGYPGHGHGHGQPGSQDPNVAKCILDETDVNKCKCLADPRNPTKCKCITSPTNPSQCLCEASLLDPTKCACTPTLLNPLVCTCAAYNTDPTRCACIPNPLNPTVCTA